MRVALIVILAGALAFTAVRLADVERQRYAMLVGLCDLDPAVPSSYKCLETVEPRTSRWWDLYYGLFW
jgi:hypothetical protein